MTTPVWVDANQEYMAESLRALREFVTRKDSQLAAPPAWSLEEPPALESISRFFALSIFERNLLLLSAGSEMDVGFAPLLTATLGDACHGFPTFGFACACLPGAHWSAITPAGPLRRWHLLQALKETGSLVNTPLRISESTLHYLAGVPTLDEEVQPFVHPVRIPDLAAPSHRQLSAKIAEIWRRSPDLSLWPAILLSGNEAEQQEEVAALACAELNMQLHAMAGAALPVDPPDLYRFLRLWERESILSRTALLLNCHALADPLPAAVKGCLEHLNAPLFVAGRTTLPTAGRPFVSFDTARPSQTEQTALWHALLDRSFPGLNGTADALVTQFDLTATNICAAADEAGAAPESSREHAIRRLWDSCRRQSRPKIDGLAERIETAAQWDDLVLRAPQKQTLRQIAIHVRRRSTVYGEWGFGAAGVRGLGITALFAGPSGTGKTMAAEVLANDLRLDLYRIDLGQVVSKYIGETEKNLSRIFDAAEAGSVVLLFDEADALFGKRSEVKDSHDRYANIEVSYLLQRMEAYRGLAILTSNRKSALDQAFLRRIRFLVEFPFPEAAERLEIWGRVFPSRTPSEGLRMDRLARLNASGGNIRSIALNAAFLAADSAEPVRMSHLLAAARTEFAKLERPLSDVEVSGWV